MALTQIPQGMLSPDLQNSTPAFKNRIINGAMVIDQRNAGAAVNAANGLYTLDRWVCGGAVANKFTVQQSSTTPTGFINSLVCTSSSAYSVTSAENYGIQQTIEGLNMADLGWGTSSAKTVTLSFWVRSSLTGTFGGSFTNNGYDRSYVFSYTINSANTWEQKSITIAGDTAGTWLTNNAAGIRIVFSLGTGSTRVTSPGSWNAGYYSSTSGEQSIVGTSGATFYLTGVQLEKGSAATAFDYRSIGTEFTLCQRYYQALAITNYLPAFIFSANRCLSGVPYTSPMRGVPTATFPANLFTYFNAGGAYASSSLAATPNATGYVSLDVTVTGSAGASGIGSISAGLNLSAEL